jgi:hypothetical protein
MSSDFGQGLCYSLGLFLAHAEGLQKVIDSHKRLSEEHPNLYGEDHAVRLWFYGAADHVFELVTDSIEEVALRYRIDRFRDKVLGWRDVLSASPVKVEDALWAIGEAKELLRMIDEYHGVETIKGEWE